MDSLGNVNHAISVVGCWIFDSNYEKSLFLNMVSLDIIFAPSVGEEQDVMFEKVYYAVRYIYIGAQLKKGFGRHHCKCYLGSVGGFIGKCESWYQCCW